VDTLPGPRASSVTIDGADDGFVPEPGWLSEATPTGDTRLVVSVPAEQLLRVLDALLDALAPPLGVMYRQKVDRRNPRPQTADPHDHVGLDLNRERVRQALHAAPVLVCSDARAELWLRGAHQEQVVLDQDGLVYCYPDDPTFRDVFAALGLPGTDVKTMADRDYVKHWFRAEADAQEDELLASLRLTRVPHRKS
jgi:hypothetical protein